MEPTEVEHEQLLRSLSADMVERSRLKTLSDFELIRETLKDDVADDNRVLEMMDRIYPQWADEPDPPAMPTRARSVCIAIPLDVAHDVVAFSECHCEESVAKGEDETNTEAYKPCLYCACQAALYRATKNEMYNPDPDSPEVKQ
jgi:hypothetical protein